MIKENSNSIASLDLKNEDSLKDLEGPSILFIFSETLEQVGQHFLEV